MGLNSLLNAKGTDQLSGADAGEVKDTKTDTASDYSDVKYYSQLDKETASNKEIMDSVKDYKTIAELVKAHSEVKSKMKNALFMPSDNATEEESKAFFKSLGVPENATEYKLDNCGFKDDEVADLKKIFSEDILFRNAITKNKGKRYGNLLCQFCLMQKKRSRQKRRNLKTHIILVTKKCLKSSIR